MDVVRVTTKNKKKKGKAMSKKNKEKLSNITKSTAAENIQRSELSSFMTKKLKKKKKKMNILSNESDNKVLDTNWKLSKSHNASLLSKKKSVKTIKHKERFTPEDVSDSKKKKFLKKRRKNKDSKTVVNQFSNKSKGIKSLKPSQKFTQNSNEDDTDEDLDSKNENTSDLSDNISEESEISCEEFCDNDEDDTDDDLEIRNELQNLDVYKEIKKLCKDNPMLFSNFNDISEYDLGEIENTVQSPKSDANIPEKVKKESSKNVSKTSKELLNTPSTFIKSAQHMKDCQGDSVQTYQQGNILHRDYPRSEKTKCSTNLRNKAQEKLQAAKFRYLNEKLYTESGKESFSYFQKNNDEFLDYHTGYKLQVLKWPMNPVDMIISSLQRLGKKLVIADMGCGDAKIAQTLVHCVVHSFDLVALNEHVTPCNISKVPLSNDTVDVVVFCLSLMGTNLKEYLLEAFRILKYGGILKIAEVESRIPSVDKFIKSIESLGFTLENKDIQHKLFVFLDFKKDKKRKKMQDVVLNPCLYKKR